MKRLILLSLTLACLLKLLLFLRPEITWRSGSQEVLLDAAYLALDANSEIEAHPTMWNGKTGEVLDWSEKP